MAPGVNRVKWWPSPNAKPTDDDMQLGMRLLFNAVNDHDQAITTLATQGVPASTTTTIVESGGSSTTPVVVNPFPGLGSVSNQVGLTAYTTAYTDNGAQIRFGDASPVAVTLNSSLTTPYFTTLSNEGPALVTATPSTGLVNGVASIGVPSGSWVTIYFDGTNWEADSPGSTTGGVSQIIAGAGITVSPAGGVGNVTVSASGGGGGVPRGALVTNANGSYWVWGDGVKEAWGTISLTSTGTSFNAGTITFPNTGGSGFTAVPNVQMSINGLPNSGSANDIAEVTAISVNSAGAGVQLQCSVPTGGGGTSFNQTVVIMWRAIGS